VELANGGRKGLELFCRERPDVVVLDLNMPEMDGIAVLQQVRSFKPDQPVIILTGAGTPEKEQRVHALGVSEFVEKEFSLHRLGDALKRLLKTPTLQHREHCRYRSDHAGTWSVFSSVEMKPQPATLAD
jgi:DNA-binding NtrC family response regulator